MTREEAIRRIKSWNLDSDNIEVLSVVIPELHESTDERVRKALISLIYEDSHTYKSFAGITLDSMIAYLEKQKENPKSADSIPSDCTSDAKSENRWHKVGDSLPDNPREVLCKDEAGNYFIGRYYVGEGWEISNYDDADKPHHLNTPVSKWIDFPSEKQKEQKPPITGNDFGWIDELKYDLEHPEELDQKVDDAFKQRKGIRALEQKPAEWKPEPESLEALMYAIEGKWEMIKPTSYLSRRLEDLYEGLVNTFNVDESSLVELSKTAYTANDIEGLRVLKDKIESSMESPVDKPAEWSEEDEKNLNEIIHYFESLCSSLATEERHAENRRWLKFLKSLRPQPHWKPSEEQMKALNEVINTLAASKYPHESDYLFNILNGLRKNLKSYSHEIH